MGGNTLAEMQIETHTLRVGETFTIRKDDVPWPWHLYTWRIVKIQEGKITIEPVGGYNNG